VEFLFVFLPLALLHFCAARRSARGAAMLTALSSLLFYAWRRPAFVLLPVLSILEGQLSPKSPKSRQCGTSALLPRSARGPICGLINPIMGQQSAR
jgi:hypothetical protein